MPITPPLQGSGWGTRCYPYHAMRVVPALLYAAVVLPAQTGSYVGAEACGKCHPAQLASQSRTGHAHALSKASKHPLAARFTPEAELIRPPRYHFQFRRIGEELRVKVSDMTDAADLAIDWAFGAGAQAVTFVSRLDANWYLEHYFSYYTAIGGLAPSPGHEGYRSNTLQLARGVQYRSIDPTAGIVKCFECHSTGPPRIGPDHAVEPAEPGVRCEACHGPGSIHGDLENPRRLSADALNDLCGRCHRVPQEGPLANPNKAWNVRHQPIYLARSACFLKSKGALSCLSCHDMHTELQRGPVTYDRTCEGCHKKVSHTQPQAGSCVGCHMPKVSPQPNIEFTNHWIGIYGEMKLAPLRP